MNYEYKTVKVTNSLLEKEQNFENMLNALGQEGWELFNFNTYSQLGGSQYSLIGISTKTVLIFKRPAL